jgi:hypothetical protein
MKQVKSLVDLSDTKNKDCKFQHRHYSPNPKLSKSTSIIYKKIPAPDFYREVDEKYTRIKSKLLNAQSSQFIEDSDGKPNSSSVRRLENQQELNSKPILTERLRTKS